MSLKHTPGPIVVIAAEHPKQYRIENAPGSKWPLGDQPFDDFYVSFSGYFGSYGPHVFVATPELLEALEEFLAGADAGLVSVATDKKARAAIAKARGE